MMGTVSVPAPIGGWNARDPLDAMEPTDAIDLINWFPDSGAVVSRGGSLNQMVVVANQPVDTLVNFTGGTFNKLIAACNGSIYDCTTLSSPSSLGSGFTSNQWQTGHYNNKLVMVNGSDLPQVYDGTALSGIVAGLMGTIAISSVVGTPSGGSIANGAHGYKITFSFGTGESLPSAEVTVTNTGTSISTNTISWAAPPIYCTAVTIYGRTSGGPWLKIASVSGTSTSYIDTGSITPSGAIPSTDTTPSNLIGTVNMKGRAMYWAKQTAGFWYASAGAFQGALTYFPLDLVFHKGGYVVLIVTWSRDNGDGVDDMTAVISSNGEVLVYQGNNPSGSTAADWQLVGRFNTGKPLGVRSHGKIASQEIILSLDGFISMDEAIVNQRTEETTSFSGKIIRASNTAAANYKSNFGWEAIYYPRGQMFLVNVPVSSTQYEQYVRNSNTGAWCRFTGWNARTFCLFNDRLYYGDANTGQIVLADTSTADTQYGYGDNGNPVLRTATQAYIRLTQPGQKTRVTGVQLVTNMYKPSRASINILQDYNPRNLPTVKIADSYPVSYWDASNWDTFYWGDPDYDLTATNAKPSLHSVMGFGFATALSYRYLNRAQFLTWFSTNYLFDNAGF